MKLRSGSYKDYIPDHYELGYQLIAYGYAQFGENFWRKVTTDAVRFKGMFYAFNKAIERHSGVSYKKFREDALGYFRERSLPDSTAHQLPMNFITAAKKNNVVDYLHPAYIHNDSILVTRRSYNEVSSFYILTRDQEKKIRVKDMVIDDYFSYRNGRIVYSAYTTDPRWRNRNYSVIKLLDIYNGQQHQVTVKSNYFSPDINEDGTEIIAVRTYADGSNQLHRLDAVSGYVKKALANPHNYFFTQTRYIDEISGVSAVRNPDGKMALVKVNLLDGATEMITPFSFNVIGYPFVKGDTIYFTAMNKNTDKLFAVAMGDKKIFRLTNYANGVYQPSVNEAGEMIFTAFTASGSRLATIAPAEINWHAISEEQFSSTPDLYVPDALQKKGAGILYALQDASSTVTKYKKTFQLFNFHSWRPEVNDPEYSYHLYSDNVLSTFSNSLSYTFNRSDRSHTIGFYESFAGWFPVLTLGGEYHLNRSIDTALGKPVQFNAAKLNAGFYIPLNFVNGRTSTNLNFGAAYNIEQLFYRGIGKNVFNNRSVKYTSVFVSFSNTNRQARQHINPRWAQSLSISYRDAFTLINSHKFVANSSFYFPGISTNHSTVINFSFQKRDSLPDLFSNTFSYSRGYEALSTRRMVKFGANYHIPLMYPDWGFGNIIFFQRVRANAFYDHTIARARISGVLTDINNRSTGAEIYFDTKVWNALPVSFGVRFSHLLDMDRTNPGVKNYWEFIVPIGLIPD